MVVATSHGAALPTESTPEHLGEDVVGVGGKSGWISLSRPEPVKVLALLRVAQYLVGLLDLFELLRVTAFVRVVLTGKFAIGLLNVRLRGVFSQT